MIAVADVADPAAREQMHMLALADARAKYHIKMPDACALLAARTLGAPLLTFDQPLRKVARRAGVDTPQASSIQR